LKFESSADLLLEVGVDDPPLTGFDQLDDVAQLHSDGLDHPRRDITADHLGLLSVELLFVKSRIAVETPGLGRKTREGSLMAASSLWSSASLRRTSL
jgi:hypothetical protein